MSEIYDDQQVDLMVCRLAEAEVQLREFKDQFKRIDEQHTVIKQDCIRLSDQIDQKNARIQELETKVALMEKAMQAQFPPLYWNEKQNSWEKK